MKILVIIGDCLTVNSSANLCHLAYLRGLVALGAEVDLLCAKDEGARSDKALSIPSEIRCHMYGVSLYEKLSHLKHHTAQKQPEPSAEKTAAPAETGNGDSLLHGVKASVRSLYGVYGPSKAWFVKARHFSSDTPYDVLLSISCPFISHYAAYTLLKNHRIQCKKWIQIWEDPWFSDIAYDSHTEECKKEEEFLCSVAEDIVYVSPVTLSYQKKLFPASADKMRFVPLPTYYDDTGEAPSFDHLRYGYFGDFSPEVRDLAPCYHAALQRDVPLTICGNPSGLLESRGQIAVHGRMDRDSLREYEQQVNVLIFLCNLRGGQIPGKIYQYSATDKLILFILDGSEEEQLAIRRYFEPFNRYVFCQNTIADIQRAMDELAAGRYRETARSLPDFSVERIMNLILQRGECV